jgi:hypothetical protein
MIRVNKDLEDTSRSFTSLRIPSTRVHVNQIPGGLEMMEKLSDILEAIGDILPTLTA